MIRKAVYSLWTAPLGTPDTGYNSDKALRESAALSVQYAHQHFDTLQLITDRQGAALLRGIGFDDVRVCLDEDLRAVSRQHWSFAKLHACQLQTSPFIHLDFDVFLTKPLPPDFLAVDAGFQNVEDTHCEEAYRELVRHSTGWTERPHYVPTTLLAYNCGIMSFTNLSLMKDWYQLAKQYIAWFDKNPTEKVCSSLYFEQYLLYWLCKHRGFHTKTLSDYSLPTETFEGLDDRTAERLGYTHTMSMAKRNPLIERAVSTKLKSLNPALWQTLQNA